MNKNSFKIRNKKLLSVILAGLFTLMPISKVNAEKKLVNKQSNVYINLDDNDDYSYERYDSNTKEYHNVSIFDDENISSHQYGADQRVFDNNFDELITNPLIWDELQVYFPESDFESHEEALLFYKKYLYIIYDCGCGYAAACDYVFHSFEGHEKEFLKCFEYPMYTVDKDGFVDFNYEVFMLKFFDYSIINVQELKEEVMSTIMKDIYEFRMNNFINDPEYKEKRRNMVKNISTFTDEQLIEWDSYERDRTLKFKEIYAKWESTSKKYINFGISIDAAFGYLYAYLAMHGININSEVISDATKFDIDDIVASENFSLYDGEYFDEENVDGPHYVYVSEITPDGEIIVSSWGNKYFLDNSKSSWTDKVLLKIHE